MDKSHPTIETILQLYATASGSWSGCNWTTEFGPRKLNLCNVRPHQARLMAEATSGDEGFAWDDAAHFLARVEADAKIAERAADEAIQLVRGGRWHDALTAIEVAVRRESLHRESTTWRPLRDSIASHCEVLGNHHRTG